MRPPVRHGADYLSALHYLYSLKAGGVRFGVERMAGLSEALGHPERTFPVIHVAGTNGKGSVSAMIDSILRAAGWKVGLYTSPHLVRLGERVQVNRTILSEDEIVSYTRELRPVAHSIGGKGPDEHPSFFEMMTAMAFLRFAQAGVDAAVVEVGMGGRLDATNVVQPEVSVITSIGLDHCEQLGTTLRQIAREKAGIIKPGRPVVIGRVPPEAEAAIREVAEARGAVLRSVREEFGEDVSGYPTTNLEGEYQRWNAATASLAVRILPARWGISDGIVEAGLRQVDWPGRWQRTHVGGRLVILDASHNPEGAQVLEANLGTLAAETGRRPIVITGALGSFRAHALLEVIARHASEIYLTTPHQPRALTFDELREQLPPDSLGRVRRGVIEKMFPAPDTCAVGEPDDVVVVTGSIYLLGEVLSRLAGVSVEEGDF